MPLARGTPGDSTRKKGLHFLLDGMGVLPLSGMCQQAGAKTNSESRCKQTSGMQQVQVISPAVDKFLRLFEAVEQGHDAFTDLLWLPGAMPGIVRSEHDLATAKQWTFMEIRSPATAHLQSIPLNGCRETTHM